MLNQVSAGYANALGLVESDATRKKKNGIAVGDFREMPVAIYSASVLPKIGKKPYQGCVVVVGGSFVARRQEVVDFLQSKQNDECIVAFAVDKAVRFQPAQGVSAQVILDLLSGIAQTKDENDKITCEETGRDSASFYIESGFPILLSPQVAADKIAFFEKEESGNRVKAFALATLCSLGGVVVWILLGLVGFIASIAGAAIAFLATWGYSKAKGKLDIAAIVGIAVITVVMTVLSVFLSFNIQVYQQLLLEEGGVVTLGEVFAGVTELLGTNKEFLGGFLLDLGLGFLFSAMGAVGVINNLWKKSTQKIAKL